MLSREWTMWYLTDEGWVRGEQMHDYRVKIGEKPTVPYYKIVTYKEEMTSPFKVDKYFEEEIIDKETSVRLEAKFGEAPKEL